VEGLLLDRDRTPAGITVSIGGASVVPRPGGLHTDLLERADRALYQAKALGRNRVAWADLVDPLRSKIHPSSRG
jgi:PleD family two-component response regulator